MSKNVVIYPGTFDPITYGHIDVVKRALTIFDRVIVGIAKREEKKPLFSFEERIEMARRGLKDFDRVDVRGFDVLLVDFAREMGAIAIIRGLRAVADFDYEFQMALMNRKIAPDIEILFFLPDEKYSYVSSSLVKEIAKMGGDPSPFVPQFVARLLKEKFGKI